MFGRLLLTIGIGVAITALPAATQAGFFSWNNPDGGTWTESTNWQSSTYPRYFFDFAAFNLESTYEVDATGASPVLIAVIDVIRGEVSLKSAPDLGGTLRIGGGPFPASMCIMEGGVGTTDGHLVMANGTLVLDQGAVLNGGFNRTYAVSVAFGGTFYGGGTVTGDVLRNIGLVSPGSGPGQVGTLNLEGGYDQRLAATLQVDLSSDGHDHIAASSALLSGKLVVQTAPGYAPSTGDEFEILSSQSPITGAFTSVEWPEEGEYELVANETSLVVRVLRGQQQALAASMDIKPGSCPNPLNVGSKGNLPVAILFPEDIDPGSVDAATLLLNGVAPTKSSLEDVSSPVDDPCGCAERGPDGLTDLMLHFDTQELVASLGAVEDGQELSLTMTGALLDGTAFTASDCVVILAKGKKQGARDLAGTSPELWVEPMSSVVHFRVSEAGPVRVTMHDVQGRLVEVLTQDHFAEGTHSLRSSEGVAGGVYFYRMQTRGGVATAKAISIP